MKPTVYELEEEKAPRTKRVKVSRAEARRKPISVRNIERLGGPGAGSMAARQKANASFITHTYHYVGPPTARVKVRVVVPKPQLDKLVEAHEFTQGTWAVALEALRRGRTLSAV